MRKSPCALLGKLFFADSVETCAHLFPKTGSVASWSTLRCLLSRFSVCARMPTSTSFLDLGREGMIKGITERTEFLRIVVGGAQNDLAPLRKQHQGEAAAKACS